MATTTAASIPNQIPELWESYLFAQAENQTFWNRFEGPEGSGMPIVRKDDLTKDAGDTIHMDIVRALTGAGITAEASALVGNEEALKFDQCDLTVAPLSHAVRRGFVAEAEAVHNLRRASLGQLAKWLAGKLDDAMWTALALTPTSFNSWFPGTSTSTATIADSDAAGRLTLTAISEARAYASSQAKIEPLRTMNGEEYYGLVCEPMALLSLKKDSTWQQAQRDANSRGSNNPLFTGALGEWDGVILFSNNRVPTASNATPVRYAANVLFGANAAARGFAMYPDWVEELFDYKRYMGVATNLIYGQKRIDFDYAAAQDGSDMRSIGAMTVYSTAALTTHP